MSRALRLPILPALFLCTAATAQTEAHHRVGVLLNRTLPVAQTVLTEELRRRGYEEGRNVSFEWRFTDSMGRSATLAAELVAARPDVLVATGSQQVEALKRTTSSIPIVFAGVGEAIIYNPENSAPLAGFKELTAAAAVMPELEVVAGPVRSPDDLPEVLRTLAEARLDAVLVVPDLLVSSRDAEIIAFSKRERLPAMFSYQHQAEQGALAAYGVDLAETYRRAAALVERILKGAKAGDLPVEQPATVLFAINLATARALGITLPPSIVLRADVVIE
jgi:putative ABC transport system substrate-binding protein